MWPLSLTEVPRSRLVRPGGLYHCCRAAVRDGKLEETSEDYISVCPHCRGRLRYRDGAWEWEKANVHLNQPPVNA
jgi:hypothetical protein